MAKNESKSKTEVDFFIHYDSTAPYLDDGKATIRVPIDRPKLRSWISLANVSLVFPEGYAASTKWGFIAAVGMEDTPPGVGCLYNGTATRGKLLFPLANPASLTPKSKVYQCFSLQPTDSIKLIYVDSALLEIPGVEISATIHIAGTSESVRSTV